MLVLFEAEKAIRVDSPEIRDFMECIFPKVDDKRVYPSSVLMDYTGNAENPDIISQIKRVYGVDITEVIGRPITEIVEFLQTHNA